MCEALGRALFCLFALLLLISPLTESVGNLDDFPRGGQDFELSIFLLLTLLCMTLLAALWGRGLTDRLICKTSWELHDLWSNELRRFNQVSNALTFWVPPKEPFFGGSVPLPLRI